MKQALSRVFWMGGSPCAGKSSIAEMLAEKYGLRVYHCDDAFERHRQSATEADQPVLRRLSKLSWDEIWMRPVEVQVESEFQIYREEFGMIVDDLLQLPQSPPILAEGSALLPECVVPLLSDPHHAVWIVPTPAFQLEHYSRRDWIHAILAECENPTQAFSNWMNRDIAFAAQVAQAATANGMKVISIDGSRPIDEIAGEVAKYYRLV